VAWRADGRGRPRLPDREVLGGILWVLRTGASWHDLPERCPSYQTCHRRFQEWRKAGVFGAVLRALAEDLLRQRGGLDLDECFIDGSFVIAKEEAEGCERPSGATVRSSWLWQTALVFFLAMCTESASPHEVTSVHKTLGVLPVDELPTPLIGDKAYDGDLLDRQSAAQGIDMIAPHRRNRRRPRTQDGRELHRYWR